MEKFEEMSINEEECEDCVVPDYKVLKEVINTNASKVFKAVKLQEEEDKFTSDKSLHYAVKVSLSPYHYTDILLKEFEILKVSLA